MKHLLSSITLLLLSTLAFGQVPNTFSSGETISSSKINANFAYVASAIKNDNISAIMICKDVGEVSETVNGTQEKQFAYAECFSSNDRVFLESSNSGNDPQFYSDFKNFSLKNYITLLEIFNEKWILSNQIFLPYPNSMNASRIIFTFYKVSSD